MLSHLISKGHTLKVATYGKGLKNLGEDFDTFRIAGLRIISADNRVSRLKTLTQNIHTIPEGKKSLDTLKKTLFKDFRPDCVITDFEPMTAYLASHYKIPLISIDNQHRMRYMEYPCPKQHRADALIAETVIRAMVPKPWVSLITTFYFGRLKNTRSFLFPPILRRSVLQLDPHHGDHVLVYVTAGFKSLLKGLEQFPRERFIIYGYNRNETHGRLHYKTFSSDGFLEDLASCKAVIATAGFTLLTESLYLGKPYLALPMKGQFEQVLNGIMLEEAGYGKTLYTLSRDGIASFLYSVPDYSGRLQQYTYPGNRAITEKLDELLADGCRRLEEVHTGRF
jgi:uncharacterized protein (TIGR00661 family)